MSTLQPTMRSRDRGGSPHRSAPAWVVSLAAAMLATPGITVAQDIPASAPAGIGSTLPAQLEGVLGVKPDMAFDELMELVDQATDDRRLGDAEKLASYAVEQNPEDLRGLGRLAHVYELRAAEARFDSSNPNADRVANAYVDAAVKTQLYAGPLALEAKRPGVAFQIYTAVLTLRPGQPQALLGLARVHRDSESHFDAIDRYEQYLKSSEGTQDSRARLELGRVYRAVQLGRQALAILKQANTLNPDDAEILTELALVSVDQGKYKEAGELAQAAINRSPRTAAYHDTQARILLAQMRSPKSAADLLQALNGASKAAQTAIELELAKVQARPDDLSQLQALSRYYGTYQNVLIALLQHDAEDLAGRLRLVQTAQDLAAVARTISLHEALRFLLQGTEPKPGTEHRAAFLQTKAQLQYEVHRHEDAAETCRELLAEDPDNAAAKQIMDALSAGTAPATP